MRVKIKKLSADAVLPTYSKVGDAGMDLTAISAVADECYTEYGTGLSVEIPEGYVGLIFPRSSISKKAMSLANAVGVVDSGYRGEIKLRFKVHSDLLKGAIDTEEEVDLMKYLYDVGERVGQLMIVPYPTIEFEEVEELIESDRGTGGFGSTNQ